MNPRAAIVETSALHAGSLRGAGMRQLLREFTDGREAVHLTHVALLAAGEVRRRTPSPAGASSPVRRLAVAALAHHAERDFAQVCFRAAVDMVDVCGEDRELAAADTIYLLAGMIDGCADRAAVARSACAGAGAANARKIAELEGPYRLARALLAGDLGEEEQQLERLLSVYSPVCAVMVMSGVTARIAGDLDLADPAVDPLLGAIADTLIAMMRDRRGVVDEAMRQVAEHLVARAGLPEAALCVAAAKLAAAVRWQTPRGGDEPTRTIDRMIDRMYRKTHVTH